MSNQLIQSVQFESPRFLQVEAFGTERVARTEGHESIEDRGFDVLRIVQHLCGGDPHALEGYKDIPTSAAHPVAVAFSQRYEDLDSPIAKADHLNQARERIKRTGRTLESLRAGSYAVYETLQIMPGGSAFIEKSFIPDKKGSAQSVVKRASQEELMDARGVLLGLLHR